MRSSKPLIGLTLDYESGGGYSVMPWYAIRENYCAAVSAAGGVPVPLPHETGLAADYFGIIDGLIVTGGAFDIDPALFGVEERHHTVTTKEKRTRFEWEVTRMAVEQRKPVLGICGGEQLLNVVLGGTLVQHIPDSVQDALEHEQKTPRTEAGHKVKVTPETLLARVTGESELAVNTAHHQAVDEVGQGVVINSRAPDGVIEGIELSSHPFCLGVQWHPEYHVSPADAKIFNAFIAACNR